MPSSPSPARLIDTADLEAAPRPGPAVLIGLGTNLGDRRANLRAAIAALADLGQVAAVSDVYETAPLYVTDQPSFLNLCLGLETDLAPLDLLSAVKTLEERLGRRATFRNGPRLIDIDILFHGDAVMTSDTLTVPHPRLAERAFVLAPLREIAPDRRHPATGLTIARLHDALATQDARRLGPL